MAPKGNAFGTALEVASSLSQGDRVTAIATILVARQDVYGLNGISGNERRIAGDIAFTTFSARTSTSCDLRLILASMWNVGRGESEASAAPDALATAVAGGRGALE